MAKESSRSQLYIPQRAGRFLLSVSPDVVQLLHHLGRTRGLVRGSILSHWLVWSAYLGGIFTDHLEDHLFLSHLLEPGEGVRVWRGERSKHVPDISDSPSPPHFSPAPLSVLTCTLFGT